MNMRNKKIAGISIAILITLSSAVPVFGADNTTNTIATKATKTEAKLIKQTEKAAKEAAKHTEKAAKEAQKLVQLQEKATKLGVNIEGLTLGQAKQSWMKQHLRI